MVFRLGTADTGGTFDTQGMAVAKVFNENSRAGGTLRAHPELGEHRQRQPAGPGRDRVRLHGFQLGSPGRAGDGAVRPPHRPAHGVAGQRRPHFLRRFGGHAHRQRRRPRRQAGGGGSQGQRHDPARPHPLRRPGRALLGLRAGVSGFPGGSRCAGGGGGGRPVPMPHPECGDDGPEPSGPGSRSSRTGRNRSSRCCRRCSSTGGW